MYYLHYTNNIFITIAFILSLILVVYSWTNKYQINTWQFPVIAAVLLDSVFIYTLQ